MTKGLQHGRCLCGSVAVTARLGDEISACFCGMRARLTRIVYADCAPEGWDLAGTPLRVSRKDHEISNPFVHEEEAS